MKNEEIHEDNERRDAWCKGAAAEVQYTCRVCVEGVLVHVTSAPNMQPCVAPLAHSGQRYRPILALINAKKTSCTLKLLSQQKTSSVRQILTVMADLWIIFEEEIVNLLRRGWDFEGSACIRHDKSKFDYSFSVAIEVPFPNTLIWILLLWIQPFFPKVKRNFCMQPTKVLQKWNAEVKLTVISLRG